MPVLVVGVVCLHQTRARDLFGAAGAAATDMRDGGSGGRVVPKGRWAHQDMSRTCSLAISRRYRVFGRRLGSSGFFGSLAGSEGALREHLVPIRADLNSRRGRHDHSAGEINRLRGTTVPAIETPPTPNGQPAGGTVATPSSYANSGTAARPPSICELSE